jgi:predicted GIY-YIG superfamily endonuclease
LVEIGRSYFVYLLASRINGTLYVGVTGHLLNRTIPAKAGTHGIVSERRGIHRFPLSRE